MTQLTIRSQSEKLNNKLREIARERGWSLNQAANYLLEKGAGLHPESRKDVIHDQLGEFIGSWSKDEADAFDRRVFEATGSIDEELWK